MIKEASELDKAWLAGYLDGDGCITISRKGKDAPKHSVAMMVVIDSTDVELLDQVQKIAGGNRITKKKYKENHRQCYTWRLIGSQKIIEFLREILPYLRCQFKIDRAKLIVDRWEECTPPNGRYSEEQKIAKEEFIDEVLKLGVGRGRRRSI